MHDGFSLGMARDDHPLSPIVDTVKDGVSYFVDGQDEWFFKGFDFGVDYDEKKLMDRCINIHKMVSCKM